MSKLKRGQTTTMDRVARKKPRTYGSKTTLDDLALNQAMLDGSWRRTLEEVDTTAKRDSMPLSLTSQPSCAKGAAQITTGLLTASETSEEPEPAQESTKPIEDVNNDMPDASQTLFVSQPTEAVHDQGPVRQEDESAPDVERSDQNLPQDSQPLQTESGPFEPSGCEDVSKEEHVHSQKQKSQAKSSLAHEDTIKGGMESQRAGSEAKPSSERPKACSERKVTPSSQEDEFGVQQDSGILEKLHQPRQTRTRNPGAADEVMRSINFGKRPEVVAKNSSKMKRRKTTGGAVVIHADEEEISSPFADEEHEPFRAAKSTPKDVFGEGVIFVGKRETQPATEVKDEDLATPEVKPKQTKAKRGKAKKQATGIESKANTKAKSKEAKASQSTVGREIDKDTIRCEIQPEVIGKRKQKTKPAEPNPLISDSENAEPEDSASDDEIHQKGPQRKKARTPPSDSEHDSDAAPLRERPLAAKSPPGNILVPSQSTNLSKPTLEETQDPDAQPTTTTSQTKPVEPIEPTPTTKPLEQREPDSPPSATGTEPARTDPVQTPKKQQRPGNVPEKHSPLSKAQVPYRVGLSRRARIEPLLRIVRK